MRRWLDMNKILKSVVNLTLLLVLAFSLFGPGQASAAPAMETSVLTLADLGADEIILHGPYDTSRTRFSLPANWVLVDGAQIQLSVTTFFAGPASSPTPSAGFFGAMLDVYFNGKLQQSLPLSVGPDQVYQIQINPADLASVRPDGALDVSFFLNAAIDCEYEFHKTTVLISSASQVSLPYEIVPLKPDLRRLPWPIYQPGLRDPGSAVVVMPGSPSADEAQAALLVMAGLGRMTNRNLPVSLITVNELTEQLRNENNLVFVGKPASFSMLFGLDMPIPIADARFAAAGMQPDDGVVEAVASPWNAGKTLLVVGGNSDVGVVKAAQAITTQNLQTGDSRSATLVSAVNPVSPSGVLTPDSEQLNTSDFTLSDLGYTLATEASLGTNWFTYYFIIPPGQSPSETPYMDLIYSNSSLVDEARSGIVLYLNSQLVGSASFSKDNANYATARINLPPSGLVTGVNQIDVAASLIPRDVCSVFTATGLWMTVYPESLIHLPLAPSVASANQVQDLRSFPIPFSNVPNLDKTTFVMSASDAAAWKAAGSLAYHLGGNASGAVLDMEAAFANAVTDLPAGGQNLIVVGKPANLPFLAELGDALPARFEAGSNMAVLEGQQVTYRFSDTKSLGFLELFTAPWDETATVLAVLGTNDAGLGYASNGLINEKIRATLRGDFASMDEDVASVVDTRSGLGIGRPAADLGPELVVEETPIPVAPIPLPSTSGMRSQILYGIYAVVGLMVIVAVAALILRKRTPPKQ